MLRAARITYSSRRPTHHARPVATPDRDASADPDQLYQCHQWQANFRIRDVEVPYVPLSHALLERLIGTIRRECLDGTLLWTAPDLEMKLLELCMLEGGITRGVDESVSAV